LFFFCENADFSGGESEMASLSSPESRIKAAAQPAIKNQARCAGRNQESRITGGGQSTDQQCPTARAVTSPGQSRIEAITRDIDARCQTNTMRQRDGAGHESTALGSRQTRDRAPLSLVRTEQSVCHTWCLKINTALDYAHIHRTTRTDTDKDTA
jgi:hypothetical protein